MCSIESSDMAVLSASHFDEMPLNFPKSFRIDQLKWSWVLEINFTTIDYLSTTRALLYSI